MMHVSFSLHNYQNQPNALTPTALPIFINYQTNYPSETLLPSATDDIRYFLGLNETALKKPLNYALSQ
jgi:hypothetical protein